MKSSWNKNDTHLIRPLGGCGKSLFMISSQWLQMFQFLPNYIIVNTYTSLSSWCDWVGLFRGSEMSGKNKCVWEFAASPDLRHSFVDSRLFCSRIEKKSMITWVPSYITHSFFLQLWQIVQMLSVCPMLSSSVTKTQQQVQWLVNAHFFTRPITQIPECKRKQKKTEIMDAIKLQQCKAQMFLSFVEFICMPNYSFEDGTVYTNITCLGTDWESLPNSCTCKDGLGICGPTRFCLVNEKTSRKPVYDQSTQNAAHWCNGRRSVLN